jgi:DNA repair photolyase
METVIYKPKGRALEYSALALNLGSGCTHGCKYCYAPACRLQKRDEYFEKFVPKKNFFQRLEFDLKNRTEGKILLSFLHDPYQPGVEILTRRCIEMIKNARLNFQILTKGGMRAVQDFDLYGPGDSFATTLTFESDEQSRDIEPGAALPWERIAAIKKAHELGIDTWVSFEPVLDGPQVLKLYEATKAHVDLYKVGKCSHFPSAVRDWRDFGKEIIRRMRADGKKFYIKKDLEVLL